jgi:hypothetical protein
VIKFKRKKRITVKLSQGEAMQVSFFLEQLRLNSPDFNYKKEVRLMEDLIDIQIWGERYVAYRSGMPA